MTRLGVLFLLALVTGMRPGEYLGLKWSDFSDDFRKVTINRVLVRPNKIIKGEPSWCFEAPKTKMSRRTLALDDTLLKHMKQHKAQQNSERLAAGPAYGDWGLVFANEPGGSAVSRILEWPSNECCEEERNKKSTFLPQRIWSVH